MKLMFDSHFRKFLEIYEPEITLLDELHLAEDEESVRWFLEDNELTKEQLKEAGISITKSSIKLKPGMRVYIVSMRGQIDPMNTRFRVNGVEFDFLVTLNADYLEIEATALDPEFERILGNLTNPPTTRGEHYLYNYDIVDIIDAINYYNGYESRRYSFAALKAMTKDEVDVMMKRWGNLQTYNAAQKLMEKW